MTQTNDPELTILVSAGRSGSTYFTKVFGEGLDIGMYTMMEGQFIAPLYHQLSQYGDLQQRENLVKLVETVHGTLPFRNMKRISKIETHPGEILERVQQPTYTEVLYAALCLVADKLGRRHLGFKAASVDILTLHQVFPNARFVHIIRDGRDVSLSVAKVHWGPNNVYAGAVYWKHYLAAGKRGRDFLQDNYFELRYEDILQKTDLLYRRW